jgi:tRNA 2-thiouridine synthesizing protein A
VTTDNDRNDQTDNAAQSGFVQPGEVPEPMVVDARGHRCPVPTLRLRRALERAADGQVVRLLADDPMAKIDVPHFARSEGFRLLSNAEDAGVLVFEVMRAAPASGD